MYSCSWNSFIMKKSLSLCVTETERKEEKNKSSLCLGVGSLCCFDSTPSRIFLLSLSAYSRQEALPTTEPGWRATLAVSRSNYIQSPLCKFHFPPRRVGIFAETCVKTLLLMPRLHGRALFYLPHLLVECSCGSGELEICSGQKWAAQMYLMRLQLTTRGLNYGEIKVLISPKWAQKKKKKPLGSIATSLRSAQIFLLSSAQCSGINTLALTVCAAWAAPVRSSVENITKTLIIPSETGNWISSSFLCSFLHSSMMHAVGAPSPRRMWTGWQFPWMRLSISHC